MTETFVGKESINEMISPEGVEEKILFEERIRVTQTMGGKFRLYVQSIKHGKASPWWSNPLVFDNEKDARIEQGHSLIILGGLISDPALTLKHMFNLSVVEKNDPR